MINYRGYDFHLEWSGPYLLVTKEGNPIKFYGVPITGMTKKEVMDKWQDQPEPLILREDSFGPHIIDLRVEEAIAGACPDSKRTFLGFPVVIVDSPNIPPHGIIVDLPRMINSEDFANGILQLLEGKIQMVVTDNDGSRLKIKVELIPEEAQ